MTDIKVSGYQIGSWANHDDYTDFTKTRDPKKFDYLVVKILPFSFSLVIQSLLKLLVDFGKHFASGIGVSGSFEGVQHHRTGPAARTHGVVVVVKF